MARFTEMKDFDHDHVDVYFCPIVLWAFLRSSWINTSGSGIAIVVCCAFYAIIRVYDQESLVLLFCFSRVHWKDQLG